MQSQAGILNWRKKVKQAEGETERTTAIVDSETLPRQLNYRCNANMSFSRNTNQTFVYGSPTFWRFSLVRWYMQIIWLGRNKYSLLITIINHV